MSLVFIFIVFFSLISSFAGITFENRPESADIIFRNDAEGKINDLRGTRADSDKIDLVSKPLFGPAMDVHVVGDYAYSACGVSLLIFDISDKSDPALLGYYDSPSFAWGVFVLGNYAYLANGPSGLNIIDVSTPSSPSHDRFVEVDGDALDVFVLGNYAYVAHSNGMAIVDLGSDSVTEFTTIGSVYSVTVSGNFAYVPSQGEGFLIVNVTNPANPILEGKNETYASPPYPRDIFVLGNVAYVADYYSGLGIINITNKTEPVGFLTEPFPISGYPWEIKIQGNYAYIAAEEGGMAIVDISDPEDPGDPIYHPTLGDAISIFIEGNYAFLADDLYGLRIVDISGEPPTPMEEGSWDHTGHYAIDVRVKGNYAYVADMEAGLKILEVTDPYDPDLVGHYKTEGDAQGIDIEGNYAYITQGYYGVAKINIADPANPSQAWNYDTDINAYDVDVLGSYAYVADYDYGLKIINVNSGNLEGSINIDWAFSVEVMGQFAYLTDGQGLRIINVTNPSSPKEEGFYQIRTGSYVSMRVHVAGSYAYIADGMDGLYIIDITDSKNPTLVGSYDQALSIGVYALGTTVYLSHIEGLTAFDVSDLSNPTQIGYYNPSGISAYFVVSGSYTFLPGYIGGFYILDVSQVEDKTPPQIISVSPQEDSINVPLDAAINITFSENMEHGFVEGAFSISPSISGKFIWKGNNLSFKPNAILAKGTTYSMTLSTDAQDTAGNSLSSGFTWQFSTIAEPPVIESVFPSHGSSLVYTNTSVVITFSKSMDTDSVQDALTYYDDSIPFPYTSGLVTWSNNDKTLTFKPLITFSFYKTYTFRIDKNATDANGAKLDANKDGIGGGPNDDYTWSFTTMPVPPSVYSTKPKDYETKVAVDSEIEIKFSKSMDDESVEEAFSFTHEETNTTWNILDGNVSWIDSRTMRFVPSFPLEHDMKYTFRIEASAKDTEGVTLDGNKNKVPEGEDKDYFDWSFTTISAPPKVESVDPDDGEVDVAIDSDIVINFDRKMNKDSTQKAFSYIKEGTTEVFEITSGTPVWTNDDKTLTFTPDMDFEEGEKYTVTIEDTAKDANGIVFEGYEWSFTTKVNSAPQLQNGGVHPEKGDTETMFTFSIIYRDLDNDEPVEINVVIDDISWKMYESDPSEERWDGDGKSYEFAITLDEGEIEYYFEASDEKHEVRFPTGSSTKKLKVSAVEEEKLFGIFEDEYAGMPTMICGPLGIIIIIAIIISVIVMTRRGRRQEEGMAFQTFEPTGTAPIAFQPISAEEELMSFQTFEELTPLEEAKPVMIQCPECDQYLKVKSAKRPFAFPCKCGAKLILK